MQHFCSSVSVCPSDSNELDAVHGRVLHMLMGRIFVTLTCSAREDQNEQFEQVDPRLEFAL